MDEFENNTTQEELSSDESFEQVNEDFHEFEDTTEESSEIHDTDFSDAPADVPIEIEKPVKDNKKNKKNKRGLAVFILIICLIISLIAALTVGYYLGNYKATRKNKDNSLTLEEKPVSEESLSGQEIYKKVNPSVVGISVYNSKSYLGYASGVVYSEDGYIVTNDHIYADVENAKFRVYTYDGKAYDAKFVGGDTRTDLAVLKIDSAGFYPATFGNSEELVFGESVYAIGRPNESDQTASITQGCISFVNVRVSNATKYSEKFIQTDAVINPGSSGGALANAYGQVIGITCGKRVSDDYEAVGYAIPTTTVKKIVASLIQNKGVVTRAKLGISYQFFDDITAINKNTHIGLSVADVSGNEELAKQLKVGDIIIKVNDTDITDDSILLDLIENSKPGDVLNLTIYSSNGETKTIQAKLLTDKSTSSYKGTAAKKEDNNKDKNSQSSEAQGGTFDFPYGY